MTPFPLAVTLLTHDTQDYEQTLILFNNQNPTAHQDVYFIFYDFLLSFAFYRRLLLVFNSQ